MLLLLALAFAQDPVAEAPVGDIGRKEDGALPVVYSCDGMFASYPKEIVAERFASVLPRVRLCYSRAVKPPRGKEARAAFVPIAGRVVVRASVHRDGSVEAEIRESEMADGPVTDTFEACFLDALEKMRFPEGDEVRIRYPYVFTP